MEEICALYGHDYEYIHDHDHDHDHEGDGTSKTADTTAVAQETNNHDHQVNDDSTDVESGSRSKNAGIPAGEVGKSLLIGVVAFVFLN